MVRNGLIALAVVAAVGTACGKDAKKKAGGAGGGAAASSQEDLAYLPLASQLVAGIDVAQLQGSTLWKELVQPLILKDGQARIADFQQKCGFDPMTAVKRVSIGLKNADGRNPEGIVLVHGLDKAKAMACLDKQKDEFAKEKIEVSVQGDVVLMKQEGEVPVGVTFIKDTTALVVIGPEATVDGVKKAAAGGSELAKSAKFTELHGKLPSGKSIWFVINGNTPALAKGLGQLNITAEAAFGTIHVTDKLAADARLRLPSAAEASSTATKIKDGIGEMAAGFVEKIEFGSDGSDMKVTAVATKDNLKTLTGLFGIGRRAPAPEDGAP
jgi:hypothetical protein